MASALGNEIRKTDKLPLYARRSLVHQRYRTTPSFGYDGGYYKQLQTNKVNDTRLTYQVHVA